MATFAATKFNPETDPSRPKLNSIITYKKKKYSVEEVGVLDVSELSKMMVSGKEPDKKGCDEVIFQKHPERPFVMWTMWIKKAK